MARARNIKPSFFLNEDIVELPYEARLLFIGLWTLADREGRLENRPKKIKMSLFPADDINVTEQLSNISKYGFIKLYNIDDLDVIQIENFVKHQTPHGLEKDSELPDQDGTYTVYFRNPKNKTVMGKPVYLKKDQLVHFYNKTGEFSLNSHDQDGENGSQPANTPSENSDDRFSEQDNNSYGTVSISDQNALNPESFNLNPESFKQNPDNQDSRFDLSLFDVNTRLQMGGLKPISQDELNILIIKLQDAYSHKHQMVKNQILGKAFEWIERQQKTPLAQPKNSNHKTPDLNVNDKWKNEPVMTGKAEFVEIPEDFV